MMKHIIDRLDHQMINELEPFTMVNPSAENWQSISMMNRTPGCNV